MNYVNIHDEAAHKNISRYYENIREAITKLKALRKSKPADMETFTQIRRCNNAIYHNLYNYVNYVGIMYNKEMVVLTGLPQTNQHIFNHSLKILGIWEKLLSNIVTSRQELSLRVALYRFAKVIPRTFDELSEYNITLDAFLAKYPKAIKYEYGKLPSESKEGFNTVLFCKWVEAYYKLNIAGRIQRASLTDFHFNGKKYLLFDSFINPKMGKGIFKYPMYSSKTPRGIFMTYDEVELEELREAFSAFTQQYYRVDTPFDGSIDVK